jgi:hypothetical protein
MQNDLAQYALEAMNQYYSSSTERRCPVIPELAIQTYCAMKLQQDNWIVLTEICWESAVITLGADPDVANDALPGRNRIDILALPRNDSQPMFAV